MAISPPSDIVLDVARAADPARLDAARKRLESMDSAAPAPGFEGALKRAAVARPSPPPAGTTISSNSGANPYRDFEAMTLATFIESAMPAKADSVFGRGSAGQMWKSMLAQQIGKEIARSGGIGIARQIEDHAKLRAGAPVPLGADNGTAMIAGVKVNSNSGEEK